MQDQSCMLQKLSKIVFTAIFHASRELEWVSFIDQHFKLIIYLEQITGILTYFLTTSL